MAADTSNTQSPVSVESQRQGGTSIVALLATLDRQVEEDRPASAQNDAVAETLADLLALVPSSRPSDRELVLALPAHFAKRAREAEAGGRHGEANRFAALGSICEDLFKPKDSTGPPVPVGAGPPLAPAIGSPSIAAAASLPDDAADGGHTRIEDTQDDAMTPTSRDASPGQPPAPLAGRASDSPPDAVATGATAAGAADGQTVDPTAPRQQGAPPIVALLAKLDKQIAADPATLTETDTVGETLAGLLEVLPNAPPSDAELVLAHCATRAREAKAGGRFDEAYFFVAVGDIVGDLVNGVALKDGVAPQQPKAEPPTT
jgi:hypothetical protein